MARLVFSNTKTILTPSRISLHDLERHNLGKDLQAKLILRDDDRETILMVGDTLWSAKGLAVPFIYAQRQKSTGPG
jgi:hypothetical protein